MNIKCIDISKAGLEYEKVYYKYFPLSRKFGINSGGERGMILFFNIFL